MNIIYFGNADFGTPTLDRLKSSQHSLKSIVTNPDQKRSSRGKSRTTPIKNWALDNDIPTIETDSIVEYVDPEYEDEYYGFIQDNTEDIITEDNNLELLRGIYTVFPDGPELPRHESRYPTLLEISAATRIQRFYRNRFNTNDNIIEDWDEGIDHPEQHPIRTQADRIWFIPIGHSSPHQRHLLLHQQINNQQALHCHFVI